MPPTQKAPVGHCWQDAAPEPENVPAGQGKQALREVALALLLAVPAGQGVQRKGAEALKKVPAEQESPPPPLLVQKGDPSLSVKKPEGQAAHVEEDVAELATLKVFMGQGLGEPEPAGQ